MEDHTKIFMTACIFMLSIAVILPLSSLTSMRFVLQRDCDNPNYIAKNPDKFRVLCDKLGY